MNAVAAQWDKYAFDNLSDEEGEFHPEVRPVRSSRKPKLELPINSYGEPVITEDLVPEKASKENLEHIKAVFRAFIYGHWCEFLDSVRSRF